MHVCLYVLVWVFVWTRVCHNALFISASATVYIYHLGMEILFARLSRLLSFLWLSVHLARSRGMPGIISSKFHSSVLTITNTYCLCILVSYIMINIIQYHNSWPTNVNKSIVQFSETWKIYIIVLLMKLALSVTMQNIQNTVSSAKRLILRGM